MKIINNSSVLAPFSLLSNTIFLMYFIVELPKHIWYYLMYIETKPDKNYPIICVQMTQRNTSSLNEVTKIFYLATRVFAAMVNASVKTFLDYTIISLTNYTSKILWNLYENHISKSTSVHSGTYSMILLHIFHELLAIFTIINNYFFVKKARVLTSKPY